MKLPLIQSIFISSIIFLCVAFPVFGAEGGYVPLATIPGIGDGDGLSTEGYVEAMYYLAITVAALLAMYKIMEGGIKWMFDGLITGKEEAKQQIQGAIFGLLIVLSAVVVLNTVNVDLTNLNFFGNAPALHVEGEKVEEVEVQIIYGKVIGLGYTVPTEKEVKALEIACGSKGDIFRITLPDNSYETRTGYTCYKNPEKINAKIGDTLDISSYDPAKEDEVLAIFKETCEDNGGVFGDGLFGYEDECMEKIPYDGTGDDAFVPQYY